MEISIREYKKEDKAAVMHLLKGLKDFLTSIDLWGVEDRKSGYENAALKEMLANNRALFLAETKGGKIIGMTAAKVLKKDRLDKMVSKPGVKSGEVTFLYIHAPYRGNNIGTMLIHKAESYLKKQGCTHIEVGVFWPNKEGRAFYKGKGYAPYNATYIKRV